MVVRSFVVTAVAMLLVAQAGSASTSRPSSLLRAHGLVAGGTANPSVGFFGSNIDWPEGIAIGPDGNVWFTDFWTSEVGKITPTGQITQFPVTASAQSIVAGPDGNLWFTESGDNAIGRITTAGVATSFPIGGEDPRGIAAGPDGNLWFTELDDGYIGRISTSGTVTRFPVSPNSSPWAIIAGPDGNMWFTESDAGEIGRFNPRTLRLLAPIALNADDNPWGLTIGPDHHVWFTGRSSGKIGTVVNGKVSEFTIPGPSQPYPDSITTGSDGNLWFTESLTFGIGRFDPVSKSFTARISLASADIPTSIIAGPGGNVWFTNASYNLPNDSIGVVRLH